MQVIKKIDRAVSKFESLLSVVLFLAMVLVVCWSVLCRYFLKISFLQGEEITRFLMIYVVYIGTSIGVKSKSHIGVDVFVEMFPERIKSVIKIVTEILCALMFVALFALSLQMLSHLVMTHQMTTTTQIPMYYVFICIPVGLLLSLVHYVCGIGEMIEARFGKKNPEVKA